MIIKQFPGGWYAEALPGGEYVVTYPDPPESPSYRNYMTTHLGQIPYGPLGRVLTPRATAVGGFRVAGPLHYDRHVAEYVHGSGWRTITAPLPWGVSTAIYDYPGQLHIASLETFPVTGSQGWRYATRANQLVSGQSTYGPQPYGLYEWTDLGNGLIIGQGPHGGLWLWDGEHYRQIASGEVQVIRATCLGDRVGIGYWGRTVPTACIWATVAELRACPIVVPQPPDFQPYKRPLFFSPYYTHSAQYGVTGRFIGNAVFPDKKFIKSTSQPLVVGTDTYDATALKRIRYYYIHCSSLAAGKDQYDFFRDKPRRDYVIYLDSRVGWEKLPSWVPSYAILCGQGYINAGESLVAFEDAMHEMFATMHQHGRPLAITTCHYDRNGTVPVATVQQLTPIYDRLIRKFGMIGVMPFADMREGHANPQDPTSPMIGGMHLHQLLYDEAQRIFDAIPSGPLPTFVPPDPGPTPGPDKVWFSPVERFMSNPIAVQAVRKQVEWNPDADGKGHRAIYGNARPNGGLVNGEGKVKFGSPVSNNGDPIAGDYQPWDYAAKPDGPQDDPPDAASAVTIRPHGDGPSDPNDMHFTNGDKFQLTGMPGGEIQTRAFNAIDIAELWNDGKVGGREEMLHANGETVRVLR